MYQLLNKGINSVTHNLMKITKRIYRIYI